MAQKKDDKIISELHSQDSVNVIDAIQGLRDGGNAEYIPVLVELLHSTENKEIEQKILTLLSDLKDIDVIPELVNAIQNKKYGNELRELTAICWENGLDFSQYLGIFVDLVIEEEFEVALEAFTVIENMAGVISDSDKQTQIEKIEKAMDRVDEMKKNFLNDLIKIIPKIVPEEK